MEAYDLGAVLRLRVDRPWRWYEKDSLALRGILRTSWPDGMWEDRQRGQEPDVGGGQNLRARMWRVELTGSH